MEENNQKIEATFVHTPDEYKELLGQRVGIKIQNPQEHFLYQDVGFKHTQHVGSIRYVGKIFNNPKAGDSIWIGVEWDIEALNGGPGKHQGIVDGYKYFDCEFHNGSQLYKEGKSQSCSFLRYGKVQIGGISIEQAIKEQYIPEEDMDEEKRKQEHENSQKELYVVGKKGHKINIEIRGADQSYNWRSNISNSREITLQYLKISDIGIPGTLRSIIPNTMQLHLDKNFLYSWDQFFQITSELRQLGTLVLSGNKFRKIDKDYLVGKNVDQMINLHLRELVLIDMSLEWSQIDILAPTLVYIEQLFLVRNNCSTICSQFQIKKDYFKNLRLLNLEQNGIQSWDELQGFRVLDDLRQIIVNKNKIENIYYKSGFRGLKMLSIEDNLISDWKSFDHLNEFDSKLEQLRCAGNPIIKGDQNLDETEKKKAIVVGRLQFLRKYNGTAVQESDRKNYELYYLKSSFEQYLREIMQEKDDKKRKVDNLDDPDLQKYVNEFHPRFYQLAQIYGSPLDLVYLQNEGKNIKQTSAKLEIISHVKATEGKTLSKKIILSMSVSALKAMCCKLFKVDVLKQVLYYRGLEDTQDYLLDEDQRQLSFYSMADGGKIFVKEI